MESILDLLSICVRFYADNSLKIVSKGDEQILTASFREVLRDWSSYPQVNCIISMVKDIWKSDWLHRRYSVVLLYNLIHEFKNLDRETIISHCQASLLEIQNILSSHIINLCCDDIEIIDAISKYYEEIIQIFVKSVDFSHIQKSQIRKVRAPISPEICYRNNIYIAFSGSDSRNLKFFLSNLPYEDGSFLFTGHITFDKKFASDYPVIYISTSHESNNLYNLTISNLPKSLKRRIKPGFYESLQLKYWEGASRCEEYLPNFTYGFECISDISQQETVHLLIDLADFHTILIYAPSDAQLESISLMLERCLRRINRILLSRKVLNGGGCIERIIGQEVSIYEVSKAYRKMEEFQAEIEPWDDYESKLHRTKKSFEICSIVFSIIK